MNKEQPKIYDNNIDEKNIKKQMNFKAKQVNIMMKQKI